MNNHSYVIKGYKPERFFRFFEDISQIPRGSGNEKAISDYLVRFAEERGLECYRDEENNVLIKMPATSNYADRGAVVLQGHVDMVCEKNNDVEHDFLKDPIRLRVDGEYLKTYGTTMGADNGIAVALMLALLDGELEEHPAYECLFTTNEEVGLTGAYAFDYSKLSGKSLINMDSEQEDCVVVGCAGGIRTDINGYVGRFDIPKGYSLLSVEIKGLMGGHSGENINSGRANANKLMGRMLAEVSNVSDVRIAQLNGGSKENAIPRECSAKLAVSDKEKAIARIKAISSEIKNELCDDDKSFETVVTELTDTDDLKTMGKNASRALINFINVIPNGVLEMSKDIKGLVEFSRNLGVVKVEDGKLRMVLSSRSAIESQLDASVTQINCLKEMLDVCAMGEIIASTDHYSRYPGWRFAKNSQLCDCFTRAYEKLFGKKTEVKIIHAGLECGIISSRVPDMDIISIGPNMKDIHSPDETLDLRSCERFFATVKEIILNLK